MYNVPPTYNPVRDQLFQVATYIRTEINPSTLVKLCILQAEVLQLQRAIITGLRSVGEAEAVRAAGGIIVAVDAEAHIRYDRMFARARDADSQKTLEEFLEQDRIENRGVSDSGPGRGIQSIIDGADVVIMNNGDTDALQLELKNKVLPLLQM
jgi:dephospho-CoA kinase